jgi:hypothetical protein
VNFFVGGSERKDEIVMQVVRLAALRRNTMNVYSDEWRCSIRKKIGAGFLAHFPSGRIPNFDIFRLHVPAREKPAV